MSPSGFESDHELYLGTAVLDDDHRILCECLEQLLEAQTTGAGAERLDEITRNLVDRAKEHFDREQETMAAANYAKRAAHQKEHQRLLSDLDIILAHIRASGEYALGDEIYGFLKGWLANHIDGADRELANYLATLAERGSTRD